MPNPVDALVLDLLEWIGPRARPYTDVIRAWRTSDPHVGAWEDANARGYVNRQRILGGGVMISVSTLGRSVLRLYRPGERTTTGAPYVPERPDQPPAGGAVKPSVL